MKIINFTLTRNNKINYFISQIPDIYRTYDKPLIILPYNLLGLILTWYYFRKYEYYHTIKEIHNFYKKCTGTCVYREDNLETIFILVFNKHKLSLPFVIFHEMRHWYQQTYLKNFYRKTNQIDKNIKIHEDKILEKDADNFAKNMCKKLGMKFDKNTILANKSYKNIKF